MPAEWRDRVHGEARPVAPTPRRGAMNKLEAMFATELNRRKMGGFTWRYESIKFRLAKGAWYTPDFVALDREGQWWCFEVKGFQREASAVRLKVAAGTYPEFRFVLVRYLRGHWQETEITP